MRVCFPHGKADCRHCPFIRHREAFGLYQCALTDELIEKYELDKLLIIKPRRDKDDVGIKYKVPELITRLSNPRQFDGTAMHNIMQRVKTVDDLDAAIDYFLRKSIINEEEQSRYGKILAQALSDPRVSDWFAPDAEVLNETEVLHYWGDPDNEEYFQLDFKAHRPDRVVRTRDGRTIVIDYKFGAYDSKYQYQVRNYMNLLEEIGYERLEGYIWYVQDGRIERVEQKPIV